MTRNNNHNFLVEEIASSLTLMNRKMAVAESCTGGGICSIITSIPGSSDFFKGGIISYSNKIKINQLQVRKEDIKKYSAVSRQVAKQMAEGVKNKFNVDYSIATTGYAGPSGCNVGQVFVAFSSKEKNHVVKYLFDGNRKEIIDKTIFEALRMLLCEIKNKKVFSSN